MKTKRTALLRILAASSVLVGAIVMATAQPAAAEQPVWYDEVHCGIMVPNFINYKYDQAGVATVLGCPTGDWYVNNGRDAGRHIGFRQNFQAGWISYDAYDAVSFVMAGPIGQEWANNNFEGGPLGYPTGDAYKLIGGYGASFQGGRIYWSPGTGAHAVLNGPITDTWSAAWWEHGIGYPTSDASGSPLTQTFERGKIVMTGPASAAAIPYALHETATRSYRYPQTSTSVDVTFNPDANAQGSLLTSVNHGIPEIPSQIGAYGTADTSDQSPYCYLRVEGFDGNIINAHGGTYTFGYDARHIGNWELLRLNTASHRFGTYASDAISGGGESITQNQRTVLGVLTNWCSGQGKTVVDFSSHYPYSS